MFTFSRCLPLALAAACLTAAPAGAQTPAPAYKVTRSIPVPDGSWDYARVDPASGHLYVARNDSVTMVDLATSKISSIGSIAHGHAVVPVPETSLLLVTSGHDDSVRLLDVATRLEKAKIAVGTDPDAAFYLPLTSRAYVMNAKAGTVSVIDPATASVTATITLKPGLEFALATKTKIYVNNEDLDEVESIDIVSGKAGAAIPLTGCTGPSGLGLDIEHQRLISACANGKAAVVDLVSGSVSLLSIGLGPDAVIIDDKRGKAFIPCGKDGTLTVIDIAGPGAPSVIATVPTEKGARTGALDPRDGTLYLPTARFGPPATAGGKPVAVPGSAHILVVTAG